MVRADTGVRVVLSAFHCLVLSRPPRSILFPYTTLFRSLTHVFFCVSKNVSVSCAYTQGKREQFSGFNRTLDAINNVFRKFSAFHDETGRLNVDGMNIIRDRKSGSAGMPRPISYAVFCLKKKTHNGVGASGKDEHFAQNTHDPRSHTN